MPLNCSFGSPLWKQQLYVTSKSMQTRVVELIPQLLDEGFIEELLVVNDDLNNAFIRYERCVAAYTYTVDFTSIHILLYSLHCNYVLGLTDLTSNKLQMLNRSGRFCFSIGI